MKMYTSSEQTAKLFELGFEKPKGWCVEGISSKGVMAKSKDEDDGFNYSIGELLEILPKRINGFDGILNLYQCLLIYNESANNILEADKKDEFYLRSAHHELIDTLYQTIVRLKELGAYDKR